MPRLPIALDGRPLTISDKPVQFSYWPTIKRGRSFQPQNELLLSSPWDAIEYEIKRKFGAGHKSRAIALSFLSQARDFYHASKNYALSSQPLLLYYSFLNLAKSYIVFRGIRASLENAYHGISELPSSASATSLNPTRGAQIRIQTSVGVGSRDNILPLFAQALGFSPTSIAGSYSVFDEILCQMVIGHRLWSVASGHRERFVPLREIAVLTDPTQRLLWLRITCTRAQAKANGLTHAELLKFSHSDSCFGEVILRDTGRDRELIVLEQTQKQKYNRRAGDVLHKLVEPLIPLVWPVIRGVPPYRRYYLFAGPPSTKRLPPLLSLYAAIFYFGSVTRYRPYYFEEIRASAYGMLVDEILMTQGQQFAYQLASYFAERDIASPSVVDR